MIKSKTRPGYEHLAAYQLGKVIQDLTFAFCQHFLKSKADPSYPNFKLIEQMNGAARSNPQNIAEGFTQASLKGYIKLASIAEGSNEELAKDYEDYLRQRKLEIWATSDTRVREFRKFRVCWVSENTLNSPKLPTDPEEAANLLLTLCRMDAYLLHQLVESLLKKHESEGGLTEKLYRDRKNYRGY